MENRSTPSSRVSHFELFPFFCRDTPINSVDEEKQKISLFIARVAKKLTYSVDYIRWPAKPANVFKHFIELLLRYDDEFFESSLELCAAMAKTAALGEASYPYIGAFHALVVWEAASYATTTVLLLLFLFLLFGCFSFVLTITLLSCMLRVMAK